MTTEMWTAILWAAVVFSIMGISTMVLVWMERKIAGNIQARHGPMHTGWHGTFQLLADTVKMLGKEDVIPSKADRRLFVLAPYLVFIPAALGFIVLPIDGQRAILDLNVGALYVLAVPGIGVLGLILAGWASHNNYSLMGGMRAAAQMLSYEVPRSLTVLAVVLLSGTMSLSGVVRAQSAATAAPWSWIGPWYVILMPVGFILYVITSIAEVNRTPFDIPEAESELVGGYHTEYAGFRWSIFMMSEYGSVLAASALGAILFLGGGTGPGPDWLGPFWLLAKTMVLVTFMIWMRWTLPRFRPDQLMAMSWRFFLPVAVFNLAFVAVLAVFLPATAVPL